jgi:hypothetical protein
MRDMKQMMRGYDCTLIQPDRLQRMRLPEPEGAPQIAATNEERHKILGDLKSVYKNITGKCNFSFSSRKYAYLQ